MTRRWIGPVACALALAPVPGAAAGVRPSLPLAVGGDNFVVHYATSGADATTPEHAAEQLGVLERSRAFWLARGYPAPTPDDEADARVDLYLSGTTLQPSVDGTTAGVAPFAGPATCARRPTSCCDPRRPRTRRPTSCSTRSRTR